MKLKIFQSNKGDCLLLESKDGKRMLCDGGMSTSMRDFVRDGLAKLRSQGKRIDVAYISHIDRDHISGVLQLLQDELEWRVYDHHMQAGDTTWKKPKVPRPPEIGGVWHNAFRDLVPDNDGNLEDLLAAAAPVLFGTGVPELRRIAEDVHAIALTIQEALEVSSLVSAKLLAIPVNKLPGQTGPSRLLFLRDDLTTFDLGSMHFTTIGPTKDGLENLRTGWDTWLKNNAGEVQKIADEMQDRIDKFSTGALRSTPFDLSGWNGIPDYKHVTAPNIASLMFFVEEDGKRLLLTGDSQHEIILDCLKNANLLSAGYLHLDALKVQHHASLHNVSPEFFQQVSARHYIFCGNGLHGNPEPDAIQMIYDSRLGTAKQRCLAPEAQNQAFTFWFSTSSATASTNAAFKKAENLAKKLATKSKGKLKVKFNAGSSVTLTV